MSIKTLCELDALSEVNTPSCFVNFKLASLAALRVKRPSLTLYDFYVT